MPLRSCTIDPFYPGAGREGDLGEDAEEDADGHGHGQGDAEGRLLVFSFGETFPQCLSEPAQLIHSTRARELGLAVRHALQEGES